MRKANVLVVEDEYLVAIRIQKLLKDLGYRMCDMANAGEAAIEKCEKYQPDVVLMDIRLLGDMTGVEAAEVIRSRFDIPVVFLTAQVDEAESDRVRRITSIPVLDKPIDRKALAQAIEAAIKTENQG